MHFNNFIIYMYVLKENITLRVLFIQNGYFFLKYVKG